MFRYECSLCHCQWISHRLFRGDGMTKREFRHAFYTGEWDETMNAWEVQHKGGDCSPYANIATLAFVINLQNFQIM